MIPHFAVMGDMRISHKIITAAHPGYSFVFGCTPVYSYKLPENISVPDYHPGRLVFIGEVLGFCSDHGVGPKTVILSYLGFSGYIHSPIQAGVFSDVDSRSDNTAGPNADMGIELGFFMDNCGRMD
jgi:hypothetical protein